MEKTTFQMIHQRKVSRKKSTRSMMYMMVKVKATWFVQRAVPKYLSLQVETFMPTMASMDCRKESVKNQ